MSARETCVNCGERREPTDLARINGAPLCHGFLDPEPTCYMRMQSMMADRHPKVLDLVQALEDSLVAARAAAAERCPVCRGTGIKGGSSFRPCKACDGTGRTPITPIPST